MVVGLELHNEPFLTQLIHSVTIKLNKYALQGFTLVLNITIWYSEKSLRNFLNPSVFGLSWLNSSGLEISDLPLVGHNQQCIKTLPFHLTSETLTLIDKKNMYIWKFFNKNRKA